MLLNKYVLLLHKACSIKGSKTGQLGVKILCSGRVTCLPCEVVYYHVKNPAQSVSESRINIHITLACSHPENAFNKYATGCFKVATNHYLSSYNISFFTDISWN